MKNYIGPGDTQNFTAPGGGVTAGVAVLIGGQVVIPAVSAAAGVVFAGSTTGIFSGLIKTAGSAWIEGQTLYFDSATGGWAVANSATARRAGVAVAAALSGDTTGTVKLMNVGAPVSVA